MIYLWLICLTIGIVGVIVCRINLWFIDRRIALLERLIASEEAHETQD